ncbi:MAG: phage tail protein [Sphingomonas sp.]
MTYMIAVEGAYPSWPTEEALRSGVDDRYTGVLLGTVAAFAGTVALPGWRIADGALLRINEHPALFSVLGNNYGGRPLRHLRAARPARPRAGGRGRGGGQEPQLRRADRRTDPDAGAEPPHLPVRRVPRSL